MKHVNFLFTTLLLSFCLTVSSTNARGNEPSPNKKNEEIEMPAGKYYIGDLCYVITKEWSKVVEDYFQAQKKNPTLNIHTLNLNGASTKDPEFNFLMFYTGSDGTYWIKSTTPPHEPIPICVDSGTIGIINTKILNPQILKEHEKLGHIKEFKNDFLVSYHNKLITIGDIEILQED